MKKFLKKQIAIIVLTLLLLSTVAFATSEEDKIILIEKSESFLQWEKLSEEERKSAIQPSYFDINLKDSIKRSTYNQYLSESATLETEYNLKDQLSNIFVKNQKSVGACWAFAYSNAIETTIENKYNRQVMEYSPMHMDYMTGTIYNRTIGEGGSFLMALAYGASGLGPVYEEDFPFESVYDEENNTEEEYYLNDISEVELNQISRARIEDAILFAPIYKSYSTDSITYKDSNAWFGYNTYTEDEVEVIRQLIKTHIKENGAVTASFYSDMGITSSDEIVSQRGYYNSETNAYYCDSTINTANHAVTIVGWDDNFSKENFPEDYRPLNDGAYIVLNSWGSEFGDNGYFYVSYDDAFIEQTLCGITEITEKETQELYDNIYEYDELGANYGLYSINDTQTAYLDSGYAANVFTREQTEENEYLSEVGIFLSTTQGVEVYVNPTDDNIDNCSLVATYTGSNALESGYHTLKLSSPVELTGDKFVVKIKYMNSEKVAIPIECNLLDSGFTTQSNQYDTAISNQGESFISYEGTTWNDLYNYTIDKYTLKNTSACIKAFTTLSEAPSTVAVTGVTLDRETVTIKEGETSSFVATVLPQNATNQNITWTSDNESVATVENGVVTGVAEGTATITVTTEDGNFTDTCIVTVEKVKTEPETVVVTGVTLDKETVTIKEGETSSLVATVLPENATNQNITWTSDNESVATVKNGVVTGVVKGTATITVTTEDGNFTDTCIVTVEKVETETEPETVAVTGVTLDKETVTIKEGQTATLKATVLPENATNKEVTWTSSNESIATISNGVITGASEGTATITVTTKDGNFTDTCTVTVEKVETEPETIVVTGVTLDKEAVTIKEGQTSTLKATVLPENATNKNITWTSSNENVATISNGVITGVAEGTATITVTTKDGNFTDTCAVTVEKEELIVDVSGVKLDKISLDMQVGEKINLVATIQPINATIKEVTWTSSNEQVAKISENGIIEALKEGKTTITVTTKDGKFTASCEVIVSAKTNVDDDIYTETQQQPGKIENVEDTTIAKGEIPKAGAKTIVMLVVALIVITTIVYKKNKKFEDIK